MPNHVHLILVPADEDGLRRALAPVHRRYAGEVHARLRHSGHFWQGRFGAVAMDEAHLAAAVRYVALNPVRARLVPNSGDTNSANSGREFRGHNTNLTDARAADAGCPAPGAVGGASALFADGELPPGLARLSVAGPLCILSPGRGACAGSGALCRAQSRAGAPGRAGGGLAVVERSGAPDGAQRRANPDWR